MIPGIFEYHFGPGNGWFRVLGVGLASQDTRQHIVLQQGKGYSGVFMVGPWACWFIVPQKY